MARYDAANNLHNVMWKNTLEERLQDVGNCEGYKYLPQVDDLRPRALGCDADVILWRNEYLFTLEKLKEFRAKFGVGGVLVTGQPGIGELLQTVIVGHLAHILITCRKISFPLLFTPPPP